MKQIESLISNIIENELTSDLRSLPWSIYNNIPFYTDVFMWTNIVPSFDN